MNSIENKNLKKIIKNVENFLPEIRKIYSKR